MKMQLCKVGRTDFSAEAQAVNAQAFQPLQNRGIILNLARPLVVGGYKAAVLQAIAIRGKYNVFVICYCFFLL
jgi:hypothetical protein